MSDELVSGTVIGADGDVVGGRVKLGANGTWKSLSSTVKLRTDEGHEVELVEIAKATIDPVVTKKADWQDIEREAGASLFVDEATSR